LTDYASSKLEGPQLSLNDSSRYAEGNIRCIELYHSINRDKAAGMPRERNAGHSMKIFSDRGGL